MDTATKPDPVPLSAVQLFRQATGAPWSQARKQLEQASPLLYTRLLAAAEFEIARQARHPLASSLPLSDPIEHDPAIAPLFRQVAAEVERLVELERLADAKPHLRRGSHFRKWALLKNILRDQHGIEWFTPVEMSPWMSHD